MEQVLNFDNEFQGKIATRMMERISISSNISIGQTTLGVITHLYNSNKKQKNEL